MYNLPSTTLRVWYDRYTSVTELQTPKIAQDALGLMATSLRIMNHNTLDTPIKGPKRLAAVVDKRPATTRIYVPTSPSGARIPGSGAMMFAGYGCKAISLSSARADPISIRKSMKANGVLIIVILEMSLKNLTSTFGAAIGSKKCGSACAASVDFFRCPQGCLGFRPSMMETSRRLSNVFIESKRYMALQTLSAWFQIKKSVILRGFEGLT